MRRRTARKGEGHLVEGQIVPVGGRSLALPADQFPTPIAEAGNLARFAYEEFMLGAIRNPHARVGYARAIRQFFAWCQKRSIPLPQITPGDVGQYFNDHPGSVGTRNVHLAALRHLFDALVTRHVIVLNPAKSVRGERHSVIEGKRGS